MDKASDKAFNTSKWHCDCGSSDTEPNDHAETCELWGSWDFRNHFAYWDATTQKLIEVELYNPEDHKKEDEMTQITLDDEAVDILINGYHWTDIDSWNTRVSGGSGKATQSTSILPLPKKCRHQQQSVTLPNKTIVYASSYHRDRGKDEIPTLGIYLDGMWEPDTMAFLIGCPDFGTPIPAPWQVLHIAKEGLKLAEKELIVEIGCIGGHGRTGLMLGVMALLTMDQPNGKEAVNYIRKEYCEKAIESSRQEWYLDGIAAELKGEAWPKPPKTTSWKNDTKGKA